MSEFDKRERKKIRRISFRQTLCAAILLAAIFISGCATLFGAMETDPITGKEVFKPGLVQKAAVAIEKVPIPYGGLISSALAAIGLVGAGVQTARHRKKVAAKDVVKLIDDLKPHLTAVRGDKDLGDLAESWEPESEFAKKIKAAYLKDRKVKP